MNLGFEDTVTEEDDMVFGRISVSPDDPNVVYVSGIANAGGAMSALYKSTDAGESFSEKAPMSAFSGIAGAWTPHIFTNPYDADEVYVTNVSAKKSLDGGNTWTHVGHNILFHPDLHDMKWQPGTNRLYIASDGGLEYFDTNGSHQNVEGIWATQYAEIATSADGNVIIGGTQDNGIHINVPEGSWTLIHGADGMHCLIDPIDNHITYSSIQRGLFIAKSVFRDGSFDIKIILNNELAFQQKATWETIIRMHPYNNQILYAPYEDLFVSENAGDSWNRISLKEMNLYRPPPFFKISPADPLYMYLSDGDILIMTSDGGQNWTSHRLPNFISGIELDPTNPEKLWVCGRGVDESSDGGKTWTSLSQNLPNVYLIDLVHQEGTNDGLYVVSDGLLSYRDDDLDKWVDFSTNLPTTSFHSSDLDVVLQKGKIRLGTWGRGIWESELYTIDTKYQKAIPHPPLLSGKDCGSNFELTVSTDETYDELMWYKNGQYVESTDSLSYSVTEYGEWGVRIYSDPYKSYMSNTIQFSEKSDQLVGVDFACVGSIHEFYIPDTTLSQSFDWQVPPSWKGRSSSHSISVQVAESDELKVEMDIGCGVRTFTKTLNVFDSCSQIVMDFDGVDDHLTIEEGIIDDVSDYTIETWFYMDSQPDSHYALFDMGADWNIRLTLRFEGNLMRFLLSNWENGWIGNNIFASKYPTIGTWQHVAVSYDSNTKNAILFLNGENVGSQVMQREPKDLAGKRNLYIGRSQDYTDNRYFDGKIDEFRFWTVPKTQQEIQDLMSCNLAGNEANLVAYYNFQDGIPNGNNTSKEKVANVAGDNFNGIFKNLAKNGPGSNYVKDNEFEVSSLCFDGIVCDTIEAAAILNGTVCPTDSTGSISFTSTALTFEWSNGSSDSLIEHLGPGTYSVTLTDQSGCSSEQSFEIVQSAQITVDSIISTDISCAGSSDGSILLNASGGYGVLSFAWESGQTGAFIKGLNEGEYFVTISDESQCTHGNAWTIESPDSLTVLLHISVDTSISIGAWVDGGTPPYSYQWSDSLNQSSQTAFNLESGIYSVEVIDSNGCFVRSAVSVHAVLSRGYSTPDNDLSSMPDSLDCFQISFPIHGVLGEDTITVADIEELLGLLALCNLDELNPPQEDTTANNLGTCLDFKYPLNVLYERDTFFFSNNVEYKSFLDLQDSSVSGFDFIYPLELVFNGSDTTANNYLDYLSLIESCEQVSDLLLRSSFSLSNERPLHLIDNRAKNATELLVYPNPAGNELKILLQGRKIDQLYDLRIFDSSGKRIFEQKSVTFPMDINTAYFHSGAYILQIHGKEDQLSTTFLIARH